MPSAQEEFTSWLKEHCEVGERIIVGEIDWGPADFLKRPDAWLSTFFERIARWDRWVAMLKARIRETLLRPETLLELTEPFDSGRALLRFNVRVPPGAEYSIDMSHRAMFTDQAMGAQQLAALYNARGEDVPSWAERRQALLNQLRAFRRSAIEQLPHLKLYDAPPEPPILRSPTAMTTDPPIPTCFLSYAWDSEQHKKWVLKLAEDLTGMGVRVALDQWSLRPGSDLPHFMERSVADTDFTVLVCTPNFATKANAGTGGVGYEKNIVSGLIFRGHKPEKFVPILREGDSSVSIPTYIGHKVFIDFRRDEDYPAKLDALARHIHNAHEVTPPPLGKSPFLPNPR